MSGFFSKSFFRSSQGKPSAAPTGQVVVSVSAGAAESAPSLVPSRNVASWLARFQRKAADATGLSTFQSHSIPPTFKCWKKVHVGTYNWVLEPLGPLSTLSRLPSRMPDSTQFTACSWLSGLSVPKWKGKHPLAIASSELARLLRSVSRPQNRPRHLAGFIDRSTSRPEMQTLHVGPLREKQISMLHIR